MECGRASRGRWARFLKGGHGWIYGRGRRQPEFLALRTLWFGEW